MALDSREYSWLGSAFYLGYLAFEAPGRCVIQAKYVIAPVICLAKCKVFPQLDPTKNQDEPFHGSYDYHLGLAGVRH